MNKYVSVAVVFVIAVGISLGVAYWQGMHTFVFAWVLNFMLMMAVLHFTQTFQPSLSSTYYNSKKWEAEGKIYKWFGVHGFRKILVWVGWEKLNKPSNPVKKNLDALKHLEYGTRKSEFGHLIIFVIVLVIALCVGFYYGLRQSLWLHLLNIVLNAYPIGVQRYNRPRLQNAINKNKSGPKHRLNVYPLP
jgi:Na+(H+)/acetate symporter ActP